ncbi:MAG: OmpA family protein [Candidatus Aminicenantes bacterium]|nr:OmpA family protein [Candidatus Aminicenantes bacterium]NIM83573.1 OmpA family protein [Candidatus Aminicenantes bacterium]NIN22974.1 OmpA family protein [Candidatus Aminicenantes bacterium]NIN46711.1 OmpA family protein [Candidatus Aminicenantes bacterium]NIN89617.1 OmpA family protein [Candidatus Aminicenantes bacterium]
MKNGTRGWEITFLDILTLLLTFFVFIISISIFKTAEYKEFWRLKEEQKIKKIKPFRSFKFELIKGLKLPVLNPETEKLLTELEEAFFESDFKGVNVYYDENKISLMVSEQIGFDEGKFALKENVKPLLLKLVDPINRSTFDVNIEGHSDSLESPQIDHMDRSLNRALSVARFLIGSGVDKRKISVSGYGPHRPVASNETPEGRQQNRRVEVNIIINNGSD